METRGSKKRKINRTTAHHHHDHHHRRCLPPNALELIGSYVFDCKPNPRSYTCYFVQEVKKYEELAKNRELKPLARGFLGNLDNFLKDRLGNVEGYDSKNELCMSPVVRKYVLEDSFNKQATKQRAKTDWLLTDAELGDLPRELEDNPCWPTAAPMQLFRVEDLRRTSMNKYGSMENLFEKKRKKRIASEERNQRKQRRQLLARKLGERGIDLKSIISSEYHCRNFISGNTALDADAFANSLVEALRTERISDD